MFMFIIMINLDNSTLPTTLPLEVKELYRANQNFNRDLPSLNQLQLKLVILFVLA